MPNFRRFLLRSSAVAILASLAGGAAPALGALPSSYVWGTSFSSSETADFTPYYTSHGQCTVSLSGGSAYYAWKSSASDGQNTRCYPDQLFKDVFNGFHFSGRFYADVRPSAITSGSTFSLATFKLNRGVHWDRVLTLNLRTASSGPTAGKTSLFLYHTTRASDGTQTFVREMEFPLRTWVAVNLDMSPTGDIQVAQNGQVVLRAKRGDGPGQIDGVHFGGYASAANTGWTIGNDDLSVRGFAAAPVALNPGGGAAPVAPPGLTPIPVAPASPSVAPKIGLTDLKLGARLRNGRVSLGVGITPERDARAVVRLSRLDTPGMAATRSMEVAGGTRTVVPVSLPSPAGAKIVPLRVTIKLVAGGATRTVSRKIAVVRNGLRARVILL